MCKSKRKAPVLHFFCWLCIMSGGEVWWGTQHWKQPLCVWKGQPIGRNVVLNGEEMQHIALQMNWGAGLRPRSNTNKDPFKIPESYISKILSSKISRIDAFLLSEDYFLFNHSHKHDLCWISFIGILIQFYFLFFYTYKCKERQAFVKKLGCVWGGVVPPPPLGK